MLLIQARVHSARGWPRRTVSGRSGPARRRAYGRRRSGPTRSWPCHRQDRRREGDASDRELEVPRLEPGLLDLEQAGMVLALLPSVGEQRHLEGMLVRSPQAPADLTSVRSEHAAAVRTSERAASACWTVLAWASVNVTIRSPRCSVLIVSCQVPSTAARSSAAPKFGPRAPKFGLTTSTRAANTPATVSRLSSPAARRTPTLRGARRRGGVIACR
jgi:hypothetical protein